MNKQLNLLAAVGQLGYGIASFNILKALSDRDWEISLFPKGLNHGRSNPTEQKLIQDAVDRAKLYPSEAPCLQIWHQFDLAYHVGKGPHIAWPIFELDKFTEQELHHLNNVDRLVVCSEWAKDVLCENNATTLIRVNPLGVDLSIFKPRPKPVNRDTCVFLNIGKWEIRKGHDVLLDIFSKAFNKDDDVELWLMPANPFLNDTERREWEGMYLNSEMGKAGKVKILPWVNTHQEVAYIIDKATCGIFPNRAEGWCLEPLEMMAMDKPVIITYYSGQTEYCQVDNSFLVNIDDTEPAYDGKWFFEQGNWAKLGPDQIEQFVEHMRLVYNNSINSNKAGVETARLFTWDRTAERLEKIFLDSD